MRHSIFIAIGLFFAFSNAFAASLEMPEIVRAKNFIMISDNNFETAKYPITTHEGRNQLKSDIQTLLEIAKNQQDDAEFRINGDMKKALKFSLQILEQMDHATSTQMEPLSWQLFSVTEAFNNNFRPTTMTQAHIVELPDLTKKAIDSVIGKYPLKDVANTDSPQWSPKYSTIWKQPQDIASQDLRTGFNRKSLPDYTNTQFSYLKAKTGFGIHSGFRVTDEKGEEYKIRIGPETAAGPFSSRVVWALGYNTPAIDHLYVLKMKYDHRILSEYNMHHPLDIKLKAGPAPVYTFHYQKYQDPYKDIAYAILKDGTRMRASDLKKSLLKNPDVNPEKVDFIYDEEFEKQIATLEFHDVSIEKISDKSNSVGPWDWNLPEYIQQGELRGYALLAAWLGQFDHRPENTRVTLVETGKGTYRLEHTISDVGSGLGKAEGFGQFTDSDPAAFTSKFLERVKNIDGTSRIQSIHFRTIEPNKTFESMNEEDAKWMARMIAQLSPQQMRQALEVSGFPRKDVEPLLQKLVERRENALKVLGL